MRKLFFPLLFLMMLVSIARNAVGQPAITEEMTLPETAHKGLSSMVAHRGYGGLAIKISHFNKQLAVMTGGRGACILHNGITLGGGGYGIASMIRVPGSHADTISYLKMGYGGPEIGYLFYTGKRIQAGGSLLMAAGAAFLQNKPQGKNESLLGNNFRMMPVIEPSLYGEVALNNFLWLHAGISYRMPMAAHNTYFPGYMHGISFYLAVLFGKK